MHLIADAPDIEDHIILAVAVDQALQFADHGWDPAVDADMARPAPLLPSPLQGRDRRAPLSAGLRGGVRGSPSPRPPPPPPPPQRGGPAARPLWHPIHQPRPAPHPPPLHPPRP